MLGKIYLLFITLTSIDTLGFKVQSLIIENLYMMKSKYKSV